MTSRPLFIPLLGAVLGLSLAGICDVTVPVGGVASLLGLALAAVFTPASSLFNLLLFLASLAWGIAALQPVVKPDIRPDTPAWYASDREYSLEGIIDERPDSTETGCRVTVRSEWLAESGYVIPVTGRVIVYVRDGRAPWVTGDRVRLVSKLRRPRNYGLPGEFDYVRYLALKGIFVTAHLQHVDGLILVQGNAAFPLCNRIDHVARRLGSFISEAVPNEEGGILRALLIGDRGYVSPATEAAYTRAGVNHILSISGFHVAIVALALAQLLYLLGRCSEWLMLHTNLRRLVLMAGLPVIVFYLFLSGAAPATARSVAMILLGALALLLDRESDAINVLVVSALALIAIQPPLLFDLSFQLSFLAIWGLVVLTPLMMKPLARWEQGVVGKIALVLAASVAAILSTLAPVAYYFHRTSATGIIANLFIVPLMGYGAVVIGFAALPFTVVAPEVAKLLITVAAFLVYLSDRIILFLAHVPLLPHWTPTRLDLFLFFLLMMSLTFLIGRWAKGAVGVILTLVIAGHIPWGVGRRGLEVTFFSLGQAESTLIRFPAGETLLVDGGGSLREGGADTGERLLAPALWVLGIDRLDVVALTHPHPDHLRGLRFIVENFPVGQFWETGLHEDSSDYVALRAALRERGVPVIRINGESAPRVLGDGLIEPLAPFSIQAEGGDTNDDTNDDSLVFRLMWRDLAILFTGDIGVATEGRLRTNPDRLAADILKVPHHGSHFSSSEAFLDAVRPKAALIAAGYGNTFHLPSPQTLERLAQRKVAIYRTDLDGTIFLRSAGQGFTISTTVSR